MGDKAEAGQVDKAKAAIEKVKEALKGTDTEAIKKATEELQEPLHAISAAAYQQAQQAAGGQQGGQAGQQQSSGKQDDDVIDAEFTESK